MTTQALLDLDVGNGLRQLTYLDEGRTRAYNRRFDQNVGIEDELKRRPGDQRQRLLELLNHQNIQLRMNAARAVRTIAPEPARQVLKAIASSRRFPHAGHAGMSLWAWDEGIWQAK